MRRLMYALMPAGTLVLVYGLGRLHANYRGPSYPFGTQNSDIAYLGYAALLVTLAWLFGLPDDGRSPRRAFARSALAAALGGGIFAFAQALRPEMLPRFVVVAAPIPVALWTFSCALLARGGRTRERLRERVIAVLGVDDGATLRADAVAGFPVPERPFTLAGVLTIDDAKAAPRQALLEVARREGATLLVLSEEAQADEVIVEQAATLHADGVRVRTLTTFYGEWFGKLPLTELRRMALLTDISELHSTRYGQLKRLLDILLAVAGAVVLVPLTPVVWLANRVANRGPLLFFQPRVGRNGKPITLVKFRTMRDDLADPLMSWTSMDDPRITPFGRVLRRMHLDELPQVLNVIRGDLSIVGPRPEQPRYVDELERKVAHYGFRHIVQPGLTGWAQIKFSYASTEADALEKLQYDLYYLRNQSLALDLRIIGRTARHLLSHRGR